MKKILFALTFTTFFGLAAHAQSTSKATDNSAAPAKVEVAGQVATETTVAEPATSVSSQSETPAKSCCSSKKSKDTAKSKSCCTDGKKSKADCADKKDETKVAQ